MRVRSASDAHELRTLERMEERSERIMQKAEATNDRLEMLFRDLVTRTGMSENNEVLARRYLEVQKHTNIATAEAKVAMINGATETELMHRDSEDESTSEDDASATDESFVTDDDSSGWRLPDVSLTGDSDDDGEHEQQDVVYASSDDDEDKDDVMFQMDD